MEQFEIDIHVKVDVPDGVGELLETAVTTTLTQQKIAPPAGLSLVLTDDDQLKQLNRDYRQIDTPTDVLSFPAHLPDLEMIDFVPYLGDIIISVPYAERQASQRRSFAAGRVAAINGSWCAASIGA